jgi:hypothetical protein
VRQDARTCDACARGSAGQNSRVSTLTPLTWDTEPQVVDLFFKKKKNKRGFS